MSAPEIGFAVYDVVIVRSSRRVGMVLVPEVHSEPGRALVTFDNGDRELVPLNELQPAPDGAFART